MPKYISFARYTGLGAKGMLKDSAAAREAAVRKAIEAAGGTVEAVYWTSGKYNFVLISEAKDDVAGVIIQLAAQAAGVSDDFEIFPLHSSAAIDAARGLAGHYTPPSS